LVPVRALKMRDGSLFTDPSRRRLTFKARTIEAPGPNRVVVPAPGSAADPTLHGLVVSVYNGSGSGETTTLTLAAGSQWSLLGTPSSPKGYRYRGSSTDAVRKVVVKADQLTVTARGAGFGYSLDEPSQGAIAVRVTAGGVTTWCGLSMPRPGLDVQDKFTGITDAPAPAVCPAVP
jgi:hypothetical protein